MLIIVSDDELRVPEKDVTSSGVDLIFSSSCMTPDHSNYDVLSVDERICSFESDANVDGGVDEVRADIPHCTEIVSYYSDEINAVSHEDGGQEVHLQVQCQSRVEGDGSSETQTQIEWELLDP